MAEFNELTRTIPKIDVSIKRPRQYHVMFYNDNVTNIEFVIMVLTDVFGLSLETAFATTINIQNAGRGIVGTFERTIAYQKVDQVDVLKKEYDEPLIVTVEAA